MGSGDRKLDRLKAAVVFHAAQEVWTHLCFNVRRAGFISKAERFSVAVLVFAPALEVAKWFFCEKCETDIWPSALTFAGRHEVVVLPPPETRLCSFWE